jgi:aspartate/methionine/tyrosine aminotransferase
MTFTPSLSSASSRLIGQKMFQILDHCRVLEREGKDILHFELGDPDFSTPSPIKDAAISALVNGRTHYEPSSGDMELRIKAAKVTGLSRGFIPSLNQLLVTPGANYQIYLSLACMCDRGDEVIIPDPGFVSYEAICNFMGLEIRRFPLLQKNSFVTLADDISRIISPKTKAIIINSPSNPTGSVTPRDELEKIFELAKLYNIWIISDEIYARIIYNGSKPFFSVGSIDKCNERTVIVNGFSKAYAMTGWRIGVATGPAFIIEKMRLLLETSLSCVPGFIQVAATKALELEQDSWGYMVKEYQQRRDLLVMGLNRIHGFDCKLPQGAFYAFPDISGTGLSDIEVANVLLNDCSIATTPGSFFGLMGQNNIRFAFCCSMESIVQALARIRARFGEK